MRAHCRHGEVANVLSELSAAADAGPWQIEPLARGGQADLYRARRPQQDLVVKLFDPSLPQCVEAMEDELDSLRRLHGALDASRIDGWEIHVPLVLHKSVTAPAIVMTTVPGRPLSQPVRHGRLPPQRLQTIAHTIVAAMQRFWTAQRRLYGDFNLHNILCDERRQFLSFVDCGMPHSTWRCDAAPDRWSPMSRDLAYVLYSAASALRATLSRPWQRRREIQFVQTILRTVLEHVPAEHRIKLLDEIHACAEAHVSEIDASHSPGGLWRAAVKRAASRSCAVVLDRLRQEARLGVVPSDAVAEVIA